MSQAPNGQFNKKTAELTRLAAAQIRVSVTESGDSMGDLTEAFTEIVNQDKEIREAVKQLPDDPKISNLKQQIGDLSAQIGSNVQSAIVAFQFFDRLCQRLDHTSNCLQQLSGIVDKDFKNSVDELLALRDDLYQHFSMKEERQLFDAVLANVDFDDALLAYKKERANSGSADDDIEFF